MRLLNGVLRPRGGCRGRVLMTTLFVSLSGLDNPVFSLPIFQMSYIFVPLGVFQLYMVLILSLVCEMDSFALIPWKSINTVSKWAIQYFVYIKRTQLGPRARLRYINKNDGDRQYI